MDSTLGTEAGTAAIVAASNTLTSAWAERIPGGRSTVFSGAGVWPLLGVLALGADEPGRAELAGAYGLDPAQAGSAARLFVDLFDRAPALHAALGLWYRDELSVLDSWLDELPPTTRGRLTGDLVADKAHLDAWAHEHTEGLIKRMPIVLTRDMLLVLATAVMVKTTWHEPFTETTRKVASGPWAGGGRLAALTRSIEPRTVRVVDAGPQDGRITISTVEGGNDIDVLLFLGEPEVPASRVLQAGAAALSGDLPGTAVDELTGDQPGPGITVRTVTSTSNRPITNLVAMNFTVRAEHDLLDEADLFGLRTVSTRSDAGHFSGISAEEPLFIGSAKQDAMAQFSATGFEAAAVTAIGMRAAAFIVPKHEVRETTITYDRPFGFAAVHRPSGLIIVAGWVADAEYTP